jgi:arylsulfatase A-like enzyme
MIPMKRIILAVLSGLWLVAHDAARAADRKPNVLLIYSDDHGWSDLGAQGVDAEIRTPNFDQLARDGVRFARGYVSAPQCVPSRAGVITGRYQQRFGVEDNNQGPLPLEETTIAERLKPAGYVTGMVGKWHLDIGPERGAPAEKRVMRLIPEHLPGRQGFDEYWRGEMRQYFASHDLNGKPLANAPRVVSDDRFRVDVQTDAALSFLDRRTANPEQPWFLYLAWYAPHVPLESPEPWFGRTSEDLPLKRRQALAMIAAMDDGLGRIREKLRAIGAERDTLVFFIGDNGAPLGDAWDGSLNVPLVGQKGMLSEGGIRTPFIAAWPGTLPAGLTYDKPVINLDVAATAAAIAGQPPDANLDGVNLLPFLTGRSDTAPHDALYWRWGSQAAVQEFPYKLIALGDRERLLFDVTRPEGESLERNLFSKYPGVAARLEAKLRAWAAKLKPPGLPVTFDRHHEGMFEEHGILPKGSLTATSNHHLEPEGSIQGWLCRNGTIAVRNGALVMTPGENLAKNPRPFLTHSKLSVAGPVTVKMLVRAKQGGQVRFSWRTTADDDFVPGNTASIDWPASAEWREIETDLPIDGRLIHLRITPAKECAGSEIRSITLSNRGRNPQIWNFAGAE